MLRIRSTLIFTPWIPLVSSLFFSLLLFSCSEPPPPPKPEPEPINICENKHLDRVHRIVAEMVDSTDGLVGISAVQLPTGCEFHYNADSLFPLASTYKIPIAAKFLSEVDQGNRGLDSTAKLVRSDLRHHSYIKYLMRRKKHLTMPYRELLKLMLQQSDNCASDYVMHQMGGPEAVTQYLRGFKIKNLNVDRYYIQTLADLYKFELEGEYSDWTYEVADKAIKRTPRTVRKQGIKDFQKDGLDNGSPRAMMELLRKIMAGEILKESSRDFMIKTMQNCKTSPNRIAGRIPDEVPIAHKTGTISGIVNDVGVIELPDGQGSLVIAAFIKDSTGESVEDEPVIAEISKWLYEYALSLPGK